jgi:hypothetical protein
MTDRLPVKQKKKVGVKISLSKYPLTSKNSPPILPSIESDTLSNKGSFTVRDMVKHEVFDKVPIAGPNLC